MRVYLCRHAQPVSGGPDAERALTRKGLAEAKDLGAQLAALEEPPLLVLTSPYVRTRQTGAEVALVLGVEARVSEELRPGADVASLARALEGCAGPVATIGHEPDCVAIAVELIGHTSGFAHAEMVVLELDG